ncbi:hypothetical protein ACHAPF_009586 [Botrytis cinerea]|uniref:Uncharacterized protein n=1 Tax=Botryotinia fuckeliana (strain T4) TaxID=999810 RepID=G2XUI3_BOTF4|nr:hypothetical protein BofuT4_P057330.1 [Botrytis cinerea T4]
MAAAPREGAAWFLKSSLKSPGYDGSKAEDFYSWMLLEVVYNQSEDEAYAWPPPLWYPGHPRTGQQVFPGDAFSTGYGRYEYMSVMYGPSAEDVKRTYRVKSSISRGQLSRQTGSSAVCYIAVPLPTAQERFIWIDLTYPVRAFMIPAAFTAHTKYQGHAIFSRLDIRGRKGLPTPYVVKGVAPSELAAGKKIVDDWNARSPHNWRWRKEARKISDVYERLKNRLDEIGTEGPAIQEPGLKADYLKTLGKPPIKYAKTSYCKDPQGDETFGLMMRPQWTLRIDVFTLACQLWIPYSQRTDEYKDVYACFTLFERSAVKASKVIADLDMAQAIDLAAAQSKELGVRLQYEKDKPDDKFIKDLFAGFVAVGLGLIPVVGPLVAFAWSVTYEVLSDTEKFTKAAGIGGKTPAFTQAVVDSREALLPMIKKAASSVFKMHAEQGSTSSIRVDPSENTADGSPQQEQESGGDSAGGDGDEKPIEQESEEGGESNETPDNEQPDNTEDSAKPDDAEDVDQSNDSGGVEKLDETEDIEQPENTEDSAKPDDAEDVDQSNDSGDTQNTGNAEDNEKPDAEDIEKSDNEEQLDSEEKPDSDENQEPESKDSAAKPDDAEDQPDEETPEEGENSENGGDETGESQAETTKDEKKSDETTKDGTSDEKEDTDSFSFIIEAGEAEVYGPGASG